MKKVLKVLVIMVVTIACSCTFLALYWNYLAEKEWKAYKDAEKAEELKLQKEIEEEEKKQKRLHDERIIQNLKDGKISKKVYESMKRMGFYPELPEGFVFPEDREPKA